MGVVMEVSSKFEVFVIIRVDLFLLPILVFLELYLAVLVVPSSLKIQKLVLLIKLYYLLVN